MDELMQITLTPSIHGGDVAKSLGLRDEGGEGRRIGGECEKKYVKKKERYGVGSFKAAVDPEEISGENRMTGQLSCDSESDRRFIVSGKANIPDVVSPEKTAGRKRKKISSSATEIWRSIDLAREQDNSQSIEESLSDLPPEVLTHVFLQMDSVNRKQAGRVCKGWWQILREVKQLRSNVRVELPAHIWNSMRDLHSFHTPDFTGVRCALHRYLENLITPELEVLHMVGSGGDAEWSLVLDSVIWGVLDLKQVHTSRVTLIISNCIFNYSMEGCCTDENFKEIIVRNSWINYDCRLHFLQAKYYFGFSMMERVFTPELILKCNKGSYLRSLINRAIPCEFGPLSEIDLNDLLLVGHNLLRSGVLDALADEIKTIFDIDLHTLLRDISLGQGVAKIYSDFLLRVTEKLQTTEPYGGPGSVDHVEHFEDPNLEPEDGFVEEHDLDLDLFWEEEIFPESYEGYFVEPDPVWEEALELNEEFFEDHYPEEERKHSVEPYATLEQQFFGEFYPK